MKAIKFFICLFAVLIVFADCSAAPLQIARLPIIFQSRQPDLDTCAILETKLARATYIPLNGTLKLIENIPVEKSKSALTEIWKEMRSADKKAKLKDAMRPLARKLDADIVICPVLRHYSEYFIQKSFSLETYLASNVSASLIVYDRRTDELVEKKTSRSFNDSASKFGKASYLAGECFDRLIEETNLRHKFLAIK